jgi:hypothetical protein
MRFKLMVLVATVSFTLPAVAQSADSGAAKPIKEKKICRRDQVTGSYLGARPVCHTKAEWQAIDRRNADDADRTLDRDRQRQNSRVSPSGL